MQDAFHALEPSVVVPAAPSELVSTRPSARPAVAIATVIAACVVPLASPTGAAAGSADRLYGARVRQVCYLPRSGNDQKVLGFDSGFSFVRNGVAYWALGDSLIDGNGNGISDEALGFVTGTIATTRDLVAGDCLRDVVLRTSDGRGVKPILPYANQRGASVDRVRSRGIACNLETIWHHLRCKALDGSADWIDGVRGIIGWEWRRLAGPPGPWTGTQASPMLRRAGKWIRDHRTPTDCP